jgi:hypothetical protein
MIVEFEHAVLGEEIETRAGYYVPFEEYILPYKGREVIYTLGHGCIEASCCTAAGSWDYVQIPGFLVKKHIRGGGASPPVSQVEIIQDSEDRNSIRQSIAEKHPGASIEIWTAER